MESRIQVKARSSEISVLKVATTDNQHYLTRLNWWHRFFQGGKANTELSLQLSLSEKDSRLVEGVAQGYAEYAGAPTIESQISQKIVEEISQLQTSQERMERLHALMADSSQEFMKRREAFHRTIKITNILLIFGVLAICFAAWITSK